MPYAPPAAQRIKIGDHTRVLANALPLTLVWLSCLPGGKLPQAAISKAHTDGGWFTNESAATVADYLLARNPAAHGEAVHRASVVMW